MARAGESTLAIKRGLNAWSYNADIEVEATSADSGSHVYLRRSAFGVGPIVKQGPKNEMEEIRADAESAS